MTTLIETDLGDPFNPVQIPQHKYDNLVTSMADVLSAALRIRPLSNTLLTDEVNLFITNTNNEHLITNIVKLYTDDNFQNLPFDGPLVAGLLRTSSWSLLTKLVTHCFYHYPQAYKRLRSAISTLLPSIIFEGFLNYFATLEEVGIFRLIETNIQAIVEAAHSPAEFRMVAEAIDSAGVPKPVVDYFVSNPLQENKLGIMSELHNNKSHQVQNFVKKFNRSYLNILFKNPSLLQEATTVAYFIKTLHSRDHYRTTKFLISLRNTNKDIVNVEPVRGLLKEMYSLYPPSIIALLFDVALPEGPLATQPNMPSTASAIILCKNCRERLYSINSVIQHIKICQKAEFDGENIPPSPLFEDKWDLVKDIFLSSKKIKDLFVYEQRSVDEISLITKWVGMCDMSRLIETKLIKTNDFEHSDICPFHKEYGPDMIPQRPTHPVEDEDYFDEEIFRIDELPNFLRNQYRVQTAQKNSMRALQSAGDDIDYINIDDQLENEKNDNNAECIENRLDNYENEGEQQAGSVTPNRGLNKDITIEEVRSMSE